MLESKTTTLQIYPVQWMLSGSYHRTGVNAHAIPTKTAKAASPEISPL
jgi:hypothetical protein